jgi:hypothetical protein
MTPAGRGIPQCSQEPFRPPKSLHNPQGKCSLLCRLNFGTSWPRRLHIRRWYRSGFRFGLPPPPSAMSAVTFTSTTEPTGGRGGVFSRGLIPMPVFPSPSSLLASSSCAPRVRANRALRNTIRCPLSRGISYLLRVAKVDGVPCLSAFVLAERGRGVGGERGAGAATNAARQPAGAAGPARGEAHQKRKAGWEVAWLGAVVAASPTPPAVA